MYIYPELFILVPSLCSLLISTETPHVAKGSNENNDTEITVQRYNFKSISNICNSFTFVILALYLAANHLINSVPEGFKFYFDQFQSSSSVEYTFGDTAMAISSAFKFLMAHCNIDIRSLSTWASIFGGYHNSNYHKSYQPAAGVLWYLDAQMLPAYELYFEVIKFVF